MHQDASPTNNHFRDLPPGEIHGIAHHCRGAATHGGCGKRFGASVLGFFGITRPRNLSKRHAKTCVQLDILFPTNTSVKSLMSYFNLNLSFWRTAAGSSLEPWVGRIRVEIFALDAVGILECGSTWLGFWPFGSGVELESWIGEKEPKRGSLKDKHKNTKQGKEVCLIWDLHDNSDKDKRQRPNPCDHFFEISHSHEPTGGPAFTTQISSNAPTNSWGCSQLRTTIKLNQKSKATCTRKLKPSSEPHLHKQSDCPDSSLIAKATSLSLLICKCCRP